VKAESSRLKAVPAIVKWFRRGMLGRQVVCCVVWIILYESTGDHGAQPLADVTFVQSSGAGAIWSVVDGGKLLMTSNSPVRWPIDVMSAGAPSLKNKAGETPEKLLTAYTFMGFWDEGSGHPENALKHYKEALESFLNDWLEYDFARERIKKLKKAIAADKKPSN
jgi:hypothetical protein